MTDAELWAAWRIWMGVATVVILIAASLLLIIWLTARRILADAVRALNAVEAIRAQTQPIWALEETNQIAEDIFGDGTGDRGQGGALSPARCKERGDADEPANHPAGLDRLAGRFCRWCWSS